MMNTHKVISSDFSKNQRIHEPTVQCQALMHYRIDDTKRSSFTVLHSPVAARAQHCSPEHSNQFSPSVHSNFIGQWCLFGYRQLHGSAENTFAIRLPRSTLCSYLFTKLLGWLLKTPPGDIELTRILYLPRYDAKYFVKLITPPFIALYSTGIVISVPS